MLRRCRVGGFSNNIFANQLVGLMILQANICRIHDLQLSV